MPPATSLQFYRKRQTMDNLSLERPQSLPIFRECVGKALIATERRIDLLQMSYYGPDKDIEQEIKKWLNPLAKVLKENRITMFLRKPQLDNAFLNFKRSEGDPTMIIDFDKESLRIVIDIIDRVTDYLKTGFADIIRDLKMVSEFMWKYCLSFSSDEGDLYLDTAVNYERQRKDFSQAVHFNLDDIVNMAEQFETEGMRVQELGFVARDLAERCKATHVPFLVIIPQAFENLRNAVAGLRKWLKADESYSDFITCDVAELELKRDAQERILRDLQVKCSNCDHKLKTAKRLLGDIAAEVTSFQNREVALAKEKSTFISENRDVLFDIDIKVFRQDNMKRRLDDLTDYERTEYAQLGREIVELSERKPLINRKLDDINKKQHLIQERKEMMAKREQDVADAKVEVKKIKKEYRRTEVEFERQDANLNRLKEILRYKTTPEILKKIFHGMPLTARHVVNKGKRTSPDKLERCCKITASHIETDWSKLYRALPFHPPRGMETVSADIDEIGKQYMRQLNEEMCKQSLWRWRRMHTRASVEDLKKALLSVRRKDIVELMEEDIARRASKPNIPSPAFRTIRFPKLQT